MVDKKRENDDPRNGKGSKDKEKQSRNGNKNNRHGGTSQGSNVSKTRHGGTSSCWGFNNFEGSFVPHSGHITLKTRKYNDDKISSYGSNFVPRIEHIGHRKISILDSSNLASGSSTKHQQDITLKRLDAIMLERMKRQHQPNTTASISRPRSSSSRYVYNDCSSNSSSVFAPSASSISSNSRQHVSKSSGSSITQRSQETQDIDKLQEYIAKLEERLQQLEHQQNTTASSSSRSSYNYNDRYSASASTSTSPAPSAGDTSMNPSAIPSFNSWMRPSTLRFSTNGSDSRRKEEKKHDDKGKGKEKM